MGRNLKVHIMHQGQWIPIGEVFASTQTVDTLRQYAEADVTATELLLGLITPKKEETPDGE